ncbi:MAG: AAA family ATPase, partial [Rhizobiales bacterium]|nr:AAA family ATPase [Hyphomicrobiales bacterium]
FGPITVLVGANGAGKSNVISFFRLLNQAFAKSPKLGVYVGTHGKASSLLHFGPKRTKTMEFEVTFDALNGDTSYFARLGYAARDELIFLEETLKFHRPGFPQPYAPTLGGGHSETNLIEASEQGDKTARNVLHFLRGCRVFHFHDTSDEAAVRSSCFVDQDKFLAPDAAADAARPHRRMVDRVNQNGAGPPADVIGSQFLPLRRFKPRPLRQDRTPGPPATAPVGIPATRARLDRRRMPSSSRRAATSRCAAISLFLSPNCWRR